MYLAERIKAARYEQLKKLAGLVAFTICWAFIVFCGLAR